MAGILLGKKAICLWYLNLRSIMMQKNIFKLKHWDTFFDSTLFKNKLNFFEKTTERFEYYMERMKEESLSVDWTTEEIFEIEKVDSINFLPTLDKLIEEKFE